jgi:hypothetical protein
MTELDEAIAYLTDLADGMEEEGLDYENNRRHYRAACEAAQRSAALEKEIATLKSAISWALGEIGDFRPRKSGEPQYWWRKELRQKAFPPPPTERGEG